MARARTIILIITIATVTTLAILVFSSPPPKHWYGEGDWKACSEIAAVSPTAAADVAIATRGVSYDSYYATVRPMFVNTSGYGFDVSCTGGLSVATQAHTLYEDADGTDHHGWEVVLSKRGELLSLGPIFIDWDTGLCAYAVNGC